MKIPIWLRRIVTRLISVIPVIICVILASGKSTVEEHIAINNLLNNSQVFLAFALPFSMLPLLIFTNNKVEMMTVFKNSWLIKLIGWISVTGLIYLNIKGLPSQIEAFYGDNPTKHQLQTADHIAYFIIVLILLILFWTIVELYKGNKKIIQGSRTITTNKLI